MEISVSSAKDGSVNINLSREDALDLYSSLREVDFNGATFASNEVRDLIKKFFSENKDVKTDPEESNRFFDLRKYNY